MSHRIVWIALVALSCLATATRGEDLIIRSGPGTEEVIRGSGFGSRAFTRIGAPKPASVIVVSTSEPLPADAQKLVTGFDTESCAIREKAEQEIQAKRQALIQSLQALQDTYTREAKLDEAVAIRDTIRQLKAATLKALPDPGHLYEYASRIGESFYFDVVGSDTGSVWGTEVYTYDSHLATAAVHAGVLKVGQRGIVKVTMYKSPDAHRGSTQNGVTSSNWGSYTASYSVERPFSDRTPPLSTKPTTPTP